MSEDWDDEDTSVPTTGTFGDSDSVWPSFGGSEGTAVNDVWDGRNTTNSVESTIEPKFKSMTFTAKGRGGGFAGKKSFDDDNSGSRGFGGNRRGGDSEGGFSRGFSNGRRDEGGWGSKFNSTSEDGESFENRGGFERNRRGRGAFRGRSNGFGHDHREESDSSELSKGEDQRSSRGGFGRSRGGGFGDSNRSEGGFGRTDTSGEGGPQPRRESYVPPPPPDDEGAIFKTINVGINFDRYDDIPVDVTGRDPPRNITSFEECNFFPTTKENIERCNYTRPTPVQKYAIPIIMRGRDLMACAQTGSGKTAAFLLPSITRLISENIQGASRGDVQSPDVLIISPTRELTLQIYNEARKFTYNSIYRPVVIYGGTSVAHQLRQLEGGCNILVCTPGRLVDFLDRKKVLFDNLKIFCLDEADRMLDMGFGPEIRKVVEQYNMPSKGQRQTLMFSATFPEEIQKLAADFLEDYLFLTVGRVGGTTTNIEQKVMDVEEFERTNKLIEILTTMGTNRTLVFVETKRTADFLATFLSDNNFPTTSIHGDRYQREREEALRDFRSGRTPVLIATSVAARGLDIPEVKHVINYDLPQNIEDYVHRIGRTGRIGNKGMATAFFQKDKDMTLARSLVKVLSEAEQDVPEFLEECAERAAGTHFGPEGGQFGSKDIRSGGRNFRTAGRGRGGGGTSGGWGRFGDDFGESKEGGFDNISTTVANDDEEWG